jgi:hypothetical protein
MLHIGFLPCSALSGNHPKTTRSTVSANWRNRLACSERSRSDRSLRSAHRPDCCSGAGHPRRVLYARSRKTTSLGILTPRELMTQRQPLTSYIEGKADGGGPPGTQNAENLPFSILLSLSPGPKRGYAILKADPFLGSSAFPACIGHSGRRLHLCAMAGLCSPSSLRLRNSGMKRYGDSWPGYVWPSALGCICELEGKSCASFIALRSYRGDVGCSPGEMGAYPPPGVANGYPVPPSEATRWVEAGSAMIGWICTLIMRAASHNLGG